MRFVMIWNIDVMAVSVRIRISGYVSGVVK
jgi:hypothetical protein